MGISEAFGAQVISSQAPDVRCGAGGSVLLWSSISLLDSISLFRNGTTYYEPLHIGMFALCHCIFKLFKVFLKVVLLSFVCFILFIYVLGAYS